MDGVLCKGVEGLGFRVSGRDSAFREAAAKDSGGVRFLVIGSVRLGWVLHSLQG